MNIEALKQLRRVVEDAPEDLFHMRAVVEQASCGTARCAIGWCIIDPWFQQNTKLNSILPLDYMNQVIEDSNLIAAIFDISQDNSDNLFGGELSTKTGEHAVTKDEVLWNIDELLAGRSALPYSATEASEPVYAMNIKSEWFEDDSDECC